MTSNTKNVLVKALRKAAALAAAGAATWVVSPAVLSIVPTQEIWIVSVLLAPALWELNKFLGGPGQPASKK